MQNNLSKQLYDGSAVLVIQQIADFRRALLPSELGPISGTSEKRIQEFSTGRFCAHLALHELGIDNVAVLRGEHREPIWPATIVGSISHCRDLAGAVVANRQHIKSIGFDVENRKQLNPNIARHVCTEEEKVWISTQAPVQQNLALLLIFSIKEAVFKCVYQATTHRLKFLQCNVLPSLAYGIAEVGIRFPGLILEPQELAVRFSFTDSHVFCGASWRYLPAVG